MKKIITASTAAIALLPTLVAAQGLIPGTAAGGGKQAPGLGLLTEAGNYVTVFVKFVNTTLIPLLFAVIFLYFAYAMFNVFVKGGSDDTAKKEGTKQALNAIIGAVLIISFWGLVNFVSGAFGRTNESVIVPTIKLQ